MRPSHARPHESLLFVQWAGIRAIRASTLHTDFWPCERSVRKRILPHRLPPPSLVTVMFRASTRLLDCRVTFFTRSPCSLCDTAKAVVHNVRAKRPFAYHEINVMELGQEKWKAVYEFDTPVVRSRFGPHMGLRARDRAEAQWQIHVDKSGPAETSTSSLKLMHRFSEGDVTRLMDEVETS